MKKTKSASADVTVAANPACSAASPDLGEVCWPCFACVARVDINEAQKCDEISGTIMAATLNALRDDLRHRTPRPSIVFVEGHAAMIIVTYADQSYHVDGKINWELTDQTWCDTFGNEARFNLGDREARAIVPDEGMIVSIGEVSYIYFEGVVREVNTQVTA